ncbi:MAG: TetR/AcrR family transcriptional regulator [Alphaproteobacteria bacterium]|nr:TetR/AcrR family transcriptional regulator [Alphaproteobacteria bacterium]
MDASSKLPVSRMDGARPGGSTRSVHSRARTKAQNREVILAAARRVFSEMGFAAATVRDVIRATPLAAGTFYNYFKSKEEVYQALRDEVALAVRPGLRAARRAAGTAEEFLAATFRSFFAAALDHSGSFAPRPAGALRFRMDTPEVLAGIAELKEDIEDAMARGVLPRANAGLLASAITGLGFELSQDLNGPEDAAASTEFATRLVLGGLGAIVPPA